MWEASKCNLCGDCLTKCLYADYDKTKAVAEIRALMSNKEAEILSKCTTCCACREYCPTGADPHDLIFNSQEKFNTFPVTMKSRMDLAFEVPNQIIPGDPGKPILSLCVMEKQIPEDALKSKLFEGLGVVKGGDYFCLIGYLHIGRGTSIGRGAQKFIDKMTSLSKDIIFLHDDCYAMVHTKIKDYDISVPFRYMHLFEYMRNYLRDHKNSITKLGKRIAYQRPCSSRYTPEKDILLDEIFTLIGVERTSRRFDREKALCCAAPMIRVFPQVAQRIQIKNINDAIESGAQAVITLCPMCDRMLTQPTVTAGIPKIFITDLCRMALGEKAFPE